ncbi:Hexaprenyldihydroxybenzoate methyltransferase, mitochondrial-like protein [Gossypium australe]|uniref:Hexaprenyldihydroxybenzoate methyltransferase, mitochondrial-like protein n=1 Tax=Gossypium australe TaxID=47621 RepID=A0A5B6X2F6_9ROSI|nr:Hexaprenyldihydroxybenzoate methyltransferase, mitochondrial-like protein [Gossypium australe]
MYDAYLKVNSTVPQSQSSHPQVSSKQRDHRVTIDKVRNDNPTKAEYWLEHTQRVIDEILCSFDDCLRCTVSLLKEETFQWWSTLTAVVQKERINWEFFKSKLRKKYVSKRYLERKKKEFLELNE